MLFICICILSICDIIYIRYIKYLKLAIKIREGSVNLLMLFIQVVNNGANTMKQEMQHHSENDLGAKPADELDAITAEDELNHLAEQTSNKSGWYDVKCGVCGRVCCSRCTADGDINRCAKTRFNACSVCNHPSSQHYRTNH